MKIDLNVKFGIVLGIINCIIWYFIANSLGFYSLNLYSYKFYVSIGLLITGIFTSIYLTRKSYEGFITFKQSLKIAVFFSLIFSAITALFNYLYHKFIIPDAIDFFVSEEKKAWLTHNRTLEETEKYILEYYIPSFGSFHILMTTLIWGIVLSLLFSAILRRKNPSMDFSAN